MPLPIRRECEYEEKLQPLCALPSLRHAKPIGHLRPQEPKAGVPVVPCTATGTFPTHSKVSRLLLAWRLTTH